MPKLPIFNSIYQRLETFTDEQIPRGYLGMSQLGHSCDRYLIYSFRRMYKKYVTPRKRRIFERGDLEEQRVINDLTSVGIAVYETQNEIIGFAGHCKGHIDGVCEGLPGAEKTKHLLEIKTMNDKSFKETKKKGIQKAHWAYYVQSQVYMLYKNLNRALFVITNKNDEDRIYERIYFDKQVAEHAKDRSINIITIDYLPDKIGGPDYFQCKWCDAYGICQQQDEPIRNCRTCAYVEISDNGKWFCFKHDKVLENDKPCNRYRDSTTLLPAGGY